MDDNILSFLKSMSKEDFDRLCERINANLGKEVIIDIKDREE